MAKKKISFALVLSSNLKKPNTQMQQIEVVLEVTGDTDPLTLQKMRDVANKSFLKKRSGFNGIIAQTEKVLAQLKSKKTFESKLKGFHKEVDRRLKDIEKDLDKQVTAFCKKDAELAAIYKKTRNWFAVKATWDGSKIASASMEALAKGTAGALTGGLNMATLSAVKTCVDLARDIYKLGKEAADYHRDEAKQRKVIKAVLKKLTSLKPPKSVGKTAIDAVEEAFKPYPQKVLLQRQNAKETAKRLDKLLKQAELIKKVDHPQVKAYGIKGRRAISEAIKGVIAADRKHQSATDFMKFVDKSISNARKREFDDRSWASWAFDWTVDLYDKYAEFESKFNLEPEWTDFVDVIVDAYDDSLEKMQELAKD